MTNLNDEGGVQILSSRQRWLFYTADIQAFRFPAANMPNA